MKIKEGRHKRALTPFILTPFILVILLSSCISTPPAIDGQTNWAERQQIYSRLADWRMKGRLGLRTGQDNGTATLIWDETPQHRQLRLLGPAGRGLMSIEETALGVVLKDSQGRSWQGTSSQALIERNTSWNIPLENLRWWLLGIVAPSSQAEYKLDDQQRLSSLRHDGWQVNFSKYRRFGDYELPGFIVFQTTDDRNAAHLHGKFILKEFIPRVVEQ